VGCLALCLAARALNAPRRMVDAEGWLRLWQPAIRASYEIAQPPSNSSIRIFGASDSLQNCRFATDELTSGESFVNG
jgi:hypothetical protein